MTEPREDANRSFELRKQWRLDHAKPKLAIEIHGPRRCYDYSVFCVDHNSEAEECAADWSSSLIDDLEPGEDAVMRFVVRDWLDDDRCCVCNPGDEP